MGYLEELSIISFRKDAEGRNVFYPYGILGKGYVLPDAERAPRMRTSMEGLYLMILACVIPLPFIFGMFELSFVYLIGAVAFAAIGVHLFVRNLVRSLPYSTERLTLQDVRRNLASGDSGAARSLTVLASTICMLTIIVVVANVVGTGWLGAVCAGVLGACLAVCVQKIYLKLQR